MVSTLAYVAHLTGNATQVSTTETELSSGVQGLGNTLS